MEGRFTKGRLFQNIQITGTTAYVNMLNSTFIKNITIKLYF